AHFFKHFTMDSFFYAFSRLDEACQRGITRGGVSRVTRQQNFVAPFDEYHHGGRDTGIGGKSAVGTMEAEFFFRFAHGGGAYAAIAVSSYPLRDLECTAGQSPMCSEFGQYS